jgi:hypothetical protein
MKKQIVSYRLDPENIFFLKQLSQEKDRSVSAIVNTTIKDLQKAYQARKETK